MRYIYTDSRLICIDNISLMEIVEDNIVLTLNSGRTLKVFKTYNKTDLCLVFYELRKKIRRYEYDIDWYDFQCYMRHSHGVEEGTWFL